MIHTVCLEMTTHCSKRCPDCCAGVGINRVLRHHPWEYFVEAAVWLKGINRIHITGGEPTMHPKFAEFAPRFRDLFGCQILTMVTNGYRVADYEGLIVETFDYINFSDYHDRREALASIRCRMRVDVEQPGLDGALFVPRAAAGQGRPCSRACWRSLGCSYADGAFWGCCVAQGLGNAVPLAPCDGWQAKLMAAPLPCETCFFSEAS